MDTTSKTNTFVVVGVVSGLLGLFVLPILLGPLAVICGAVAISQNSKNGGIWAIILGGIDIVVVLCAMVSIYNRFMG